MAGPTSATRNGGGRHVAFLTLGSDGSVGTTPVMMIDRVISAGLPKDGTSGYHTPSIKHDRDDDAYNTFVKTYAPAPASAGSGSKYNDGFDETTVSSNAPGLLCVVLGAKSNKAGDKGRKLTAVQGYLGLESGGSSEDAETRTQPACEFKPSKVTEAAITFDPKTLWPDIFDPAATTCVLAAGLASDAFFRDNV